MDLSMDTSVKNITPRQTIAFAPLYNIEPDYDLLGLDFNGYSIITAADFYEIYKDNVNAIRNSGNRFLEAEAHCNPQYFLVATYAHNSMESNIDLDKFSGNLIFDAFIRTLLYARLHKSGNLQMGTFFISRKNGEIYRNASHTDFLCLYEKREYLNYTHIYEQYKVSRADILDIITKTNLIEANFPDKFPEAFQAAWFFTRAYETSDIAYKIINFITTIEKLIASDGSKGVIQFKISSRLSFLMKKDVRKFIDEIYNIRSRIIHDGDVVNKKTTIAKLYEQCSELENFCRILLQHFFNKYIEEDKTTLKEVANEINDRMFELLSKKT